VVVLKSQRGPEEIIGKYNEKHPKIQPTISAISTSTILKID